MNIKILGTGRKLPERVVTNDELAALIDTNDEWITSKTGIKTRHVCTTETLADLAEGAAREAIEKSGLTISDVDIVICGTVSSDYITPALACVVSQRLGIERPAFDVNGACSGFIYMLDVADAYISAGKAKNILLVAAEMLSRHTDWTDRATCVLFGDGAGACVVSAGNALKYIRVNADGNADPLYAKAGTGNNPFAPEPLTQTFIRMEGQKVFKFAVKTIEDEIERALAALGLDAGNVDYFLLHQANLRIIDAARSRLGQPAEKFPTNISKYGNMSSASIIILLDEMLEESKIKPGDTLMFVAFGAGMTSGACVLEWG